MTRLMYLFLLILGILTASIFLIPQVKEKMSKSTGIPFYDKSICEIVGFEKNCEDVVGYESVYRVWFAFTMFFLLMAIITIGVRTSKDFRASLQNGFWFFKILIIIGIMVGAFYIPQDPFNDIWQYIGLIGAVLFIFVQVVYLIDFAHNWTESWIRNAEDGNKCYYIGFIFSALVMYGFALAGFIGAYIEFTSSSGCHLNKSMISVNLILCIISSVIALLPVVQNANPSSGILQASLVSLYVSYLTLSGIGAAPNSSKSSAYCNRNFGNIEDAGIAMIIVGIVLAVLTIFYVSFTSKDESSASIVSDEESPVQKVSDDEEDGVQYNYWFFHALCVLGSLYFMMIMTNWFRPESVSDGMVFAANWPAFWTQVVASWLCIAIYIWTLVAPIVFPDRNFSWVSDTI